jgi:hypothetical protein
MSKHLGRLFFCAWPKRKKLNDLYEQASEKVEQQFDVIKLFSNIRTLKCIIKNSLYSKGIK